MAQRYANPLKGALKLRLGPKWGAGPEFNVPAGHARPQQAGPTDRAN